jgi:hypothetical protein
MDILTFLGEDVGL